VRAHRVLVTLPVMTGIHGGIVVSSERSANCSNGIQVCRSRTPLLRCRVCSLPTVDGELQYNYQQRDTIRV
jgi:hypothetical protein